MSNFLIDKFKGKYRVMAAYDKYALDFPKNLDGRYSTDDLYIPCKNKGMVFHYGGKILEFYCSSIGVGRNIIKSIYYELINSENCVLTVSEKANKNGILIHTKKIKIKNNNKYQKDIKQNNLIFNLMETDNEVIFRFKLEDFQKIEHILQPNKISANRSPFSLKNLPKTDYKIPSNDLHRYKKIIENSHKNNTLLIAHTLNSFMKTITKKKYKMEDMRCDMRRKGLKGKEYIHSIGMWDKYLDYLRKEINVNEDS